MSEGGPAVRARGIRVAFGGIEAVRGVDLDLMPGEIHAIVGENGAGKSSLAKAIAGVYRPSGGTLEVNGELVSFSGPRQAIDHGIALIHQEPLVFPSLDVADNMFVGRQPRGRFGAIDRASMYRQAASVLDSLGVRLDPRARVRGMSVAQQQMVEMATALSQNARILLMDETTASLTPVETEELFKVARRLRDSGCALAFVSHRLEEVFALCDRVTALRDGELVATVPTADTTKDDVVRMMIGRDLATERSSPNTPGEALLKVRGLTRGKQFRDVSFELRAGEILGIGGLVGVGRTSVAKSLFGIERPDSGEIEIDGQVVRIASPQQAMSAGIALIPEDRRQTGLFMPQSIEDNVSIAALRSLASSGWVRREDVRDVAGSWMERLGIVARSIGQVAQELSGGNQQKVVIAKWLQTKPKILVLDEPTRGIDVGAKAEVYKAMRELAQSGMALLMISSELQELLALSDRILVMREGRIVDEFAAGDATEEKVMFAATGQGAVTG